LLVICGEDDPSDGNPCLKLFELERKDKRGEPELARMSRISLALTPNCSSASSKCEPVQVCAHEGSPSSTALAVAYSDGSLVVHRGGRDLRKERGMGQKRIVEGNGRDLVSGMAFRDDNDRLLLYVATNSAVKCYSLSKDKETLAVLDRVGCEPGLAAPTVGQHEMHLVTGREDAVYCYTPEGRGQCYAFGGRKVALHWFRSSYLALASSDDGQRLNEEGEGSKQMLTVFDVRNKFVAFSAPVRPVKAILSEWGWLFAICDDCKMYRLEEKDVQAKLDSLFKKNFYDVAVKVARMHDYQQDGLVDIYRQYGDHLYAKGEYEAAIDNYAKTIGHLEPSYVIRRFLEAHRIHHLTTYLQALHSQGLANEDHTTLLLNCYTKLKDKHHLDEFIFKDRVDVDFDVDIAVKVCRQSGYNEHALALSERHGKHEWYLRMQIEDNKNYKEALEYITKLNFEEAEVSMRQYGSALMQRLPKQTTELLKRLCTDFKPSNAPLVTEDMIEGKDEVNKSVTLCQQPFLRVMKRNNLLPPSNFSTYSYETPTKWWTSWSTW